MSVGTIPGLLRAHATERPDATFCTFVANATSQTISFADLERASRAYAEAYRRRGVGRGDVVLVMLKHSPHLFYAYLGAMLVGAIPSFMPFPTPKQRSDLFWNDHRALFEVIQPRLIVSYDENLRAAAAALGDALAPTLCADDALLREELPTGWFGDAVGEGEVVCLQHSSGTTGLKKGVMLTNRAIVGEVSAYARRLGFGAEDSIASWLPLYHDMGFVACFMTSVVLGTHLVALDPFEWVMRPTMLLDAIETHRSTFAWLPNFAFSHIVAHARGDRRWDLSSLRALINCSEPCKAHTFDRFAARFATSGITPEQLHVCYAMAENVFAVTQSELGGGVRRIDADPIAFSRGRVRQAEPGERAVALLSCGTAIEGVRVEIRDESGKVVPERAVGDIYVGGSFLFDGYYRRPELTAERLRDGWYRTGDRGFVAAGELFVTGRVDDMLIVNGRNYYAHEVEAIASEVAGVVPGRVVAIGIEDERADATAIVVLVEVRADAESALVTRAVRVAVLEALGLAVQSVSALEPGRLIKTTSGKISREKNRALYLQGSLR
ncbi:MAG: AMP-binding protein [bacterium]|nr:AMP-binding protein [bacterium]